MSNNQKTLKSYLFTDYIPAELRENKTWKIVYYVKNPFSNKLVRKENRVKPLKDLKQRRLLGMQMVMNINNKLQNGWSPFLENNNITAYTKLIDVFDLYLDNVKYKVSKNELRKDTLRSYTSFIANIKTYLVNNNINDMLTINFNDDLINSFLNFIYYDKQNTARTRNNYLRFIKTFVEYLILNKYISINPTLRIQTIQESKKERVVIPYNVLLSIFEHLEKTNKDYLLMCYTVYYCFIRRTEMTKLKVKDVFLKNGIIYMSSTNSKNNQNKPVTIPDTLIILFSKHLNKANNNDYLFSSTFKPGPRQLKPKKISDEWNKLRNQLNLPKCYQWYSLKDTGITNMLMSGVPTIDVRNQARHHSIVQTEAYTPKEIIKAVSSIKKINF